MKRDGKKTRSWAQHCLVAALSFGIIFFAVHLSLAARRSAALSQFLYHPALAGMIAAAACLLCYFFALLRRRRHDMEIAVRLWEQRVKLMAERNDAMTVFYDIPTGVFHSAAVMEKEILGEQADERALAPLLHYIEHSLVGTEEYDAFLRKISAGENPVTAEFLQVRRNGINVWYKAVSNTIFDENGRPRTAVITYQDNTAQREAELAYAFHNQSIESLPQEKVGVYIYDLTTEALLSTRGALVVDFSGCAFGANARNAYYAERHVLAEERAAVLTMLNRERLLSLYYDNIFTDRMNFRYVAANGALSWHELSVRMAADPATGNVVAFLVDRDVDEEERQMLETLSLAHSDPLTGVLNRAAFQEDFHKLLRLHPNSVNVLLVVDIDDFKTVNDAYGHEVGDSVLRTLADKLGEVIRPADLLGRLGGDEFLIVLADMPGDALEKKVEEITLALRWELTDGRIITTSIGAALYPQDGDSFQTLYPCADKALYNAKHQGKKTAAFYSPLLGEKNGPQLGKSELMQGFDVSRYRFAVDVIGAFLLIYDVGTGVFTVDPGSPSLPVDIDSHYFSRDALVQRGIISAGDAKTVYSAVTAVLTGKRADACSTIQMCLRDGRCRWANVYISRVRHFKNSAPQILMIVKDVDRETALEERVRTLTERDALTGLYERGTFFRRAEELVAAREPGYYVIACLNINQFKVINDRHGAAVGDEVLRRIAAQLKESMAETGGLCCRVMGDRFALLFPAAHLEEEQRRVDRDTLKTTALPGQTLHFSVGHYIITDKSLSGSAMYDRALLAMQSVAGRVDVGSALYKEAMRRDVLSSQQITEDAAAALSGGQFKLWLQPQFNHVTGELVGAEVLTRWQHPRLGLIPPDKFIPVFERTGFIFELDKYVWEQTCALMRGWLAAGTCPPYVSVNISRYDLTHPELCEWLTALTGRYEVPVERLHLEITESIFAEESTALWANVRRLRQGGFTVELDDFGRGYSALNLLNNLPVDVLKLDMRFIQGIDDSGRGSGVLASVVRMARWQGMPVIAEGVETPQQAEYLRGIDCRLVQGYLYARPMPAEEMSAFSAACKNAPPDRKGEWISAPADPMALETFIFSDYAPAACTLEYCGGRWEMIRANDRCARLLMGGQAGEQELLARPWNQGYTPESRRAEETALLRAVETGETVEYDVVCAHAGDDGLCYLHIRVRVTARTPERVMLFCGMEDRTEAILLRQQGERAKRCLALYGRAVGSAALCETQDDVLREVLRSVLVYAGAERVCVFGIAPLEILCALPPENMPLPSELRETDWAGLLANAGSAELPSEQGGSSTFFALRREGWLCGVLGLYRPCAAVELDTALRPLCEYIAALLPREGSRPRLKWHL